MRKITISCALALCGFLSAQQTQFGVKGGYALSKIQSEDLEDSFDGGNVQNKSKSGYFVGAFVEYKLNDKFALQGELQYASLGGQFDINVEAEGLRATVQDKFNFNQIVIPVSAKFYATPQLAFFAGPSVAFTTGYKSDIKIKDTNIPAAVLTDLNGTFAEIEKQQDQQFEDGLKSTNFNLFFGGEYTFYKSLFFDARYTIGLSNYENEPVNGSKTSMNYLQLGLGYKF